MATNFRIPYVFIVRSANTLPATTTKTSALTLDQFGVYGANQAALVAGTAAAAPYIQFFQGTNIPRIGNKRSDRIYKTNILEWYKVPAQTTATPQITTITGLVLNPGDELTVAFRLHSRFIDNAFSNGLLKSVLVLTPCPVCDGDPCAELDAAGYDAAYNSITSKINADVYLGQYLTAVKSGSGAASTVTITGKALVNPFPNNANDPHQNVFFHDKLTFNTYVGNNPEISQDYMWVDDRCDIQGVVTTTQRSTYAHGSAAEARRRQIDYYSYMVPEFKDLYSDADFNVYYRDLVDAANYDIYFLKYYTPEAGANDQTVRLVEGAEIWIPTGNAAATETILANFIGTAASDKTASGTVAFTPLTP